MAGTAPKTASLDLARLRHVVAAHAPALRLHPRDRYMPCDVEHFAEHSELRARVGGEAGGRGGDGHLLLPRGTVDWDTLLAAQEAWLAEADERVGGARGPTRGGTAERPGLWLALREEGRAGAPPDRVDDVPLYAHVKAVGATRPGEVDAAGGAGVGEAEAPGADEPPPAETPPSDDEPPSALEINYLTFYAHNGSYDVGGLGLLKAGAHDGDWEHLTVRALWPSGRRVGAWYNAHRSRDGQWVAHGEAPTDERTGRLLAYVALHGHGTYPKPGRYFRHFSLANDLCSDDGVRWTPRRVVLLPCCSRARGVVGETGEGETRAREGAGEAAGEAAGDGAATWRVLVVPCRGSTVDRSNPDGGGGGGADDLVGDAPPAPAALDLPPLPADPPEVVAVRGSSPWVAFRGLWGETEAPINQAWFTGLECPVSRSVVLRLFGHHAREVRSL